MTNLYHFVFGSVKMSTTTYKTKKCNVLDSIVYKVSKYKNNKKIKMYTIQNTSFQVVVFQTHNNELYARSVNKFYISKHIDRTDTFATLSKYMIYQFFGI